MRRFTLALWVVILGIGCSSEEQVSIFDTLPISFIPDSASIIGSSTYYFTDSIIFRTDNLVTDSLDLARARMVEAEYFSGDTSFNNFPIQSITFNDATRAEIITNGSDQASYTERSGIGSILTSSPVGFKVNADQQSLITCITITSKRRIDTLSQEDFIEGLDTFVNINTDVPFQLNIIDTDTIEMQFCNPFNELDQVTQFADRQNLVNDERIIIHRTDLIFKRSNN